MLKQLRKPLLIVSVICLVLLCLPAQPAYAIPWIFPLPDGGTTIPGSDVTIDFQVEPTGSGFLSGWVEGEEGLQLPFTLHGEAAEGYVFDRWELEDTGTGAVTTLYASQMAFNRDVYVCDGAFPVPPQLIETYAVAQGHTYSFTAYFSVAPPSGSYVIYRETVPGGSGTITGNGWLIPRQLGTGVTYQAFPMEGCTFSHWELLDVQTGGVMGYHDNPLSIVPYTNSNEYTYILSAHFDGQPSSPGYALDISTEPEAAGTISCEPLLEGYAPGVTVELYQKPAMGGTGGVIGMPVPNVFQGWEIVNDDGSVVTDASNPLYLTMDGNKTVTARYTGDGTTNNLFSYTVQMEADPAGGGSISGTVEGAGYDGAQIAGGTPITISTTAEDGYTFGYLQLVDTTYGNIFRYMENPLTVNPGTSTVGYPYKVIAHFSAVAAPEYTLEASASPAESATVVRAPSRGSYASGEEVSVFCLVSSGYTFDHWEVTDGEGNSSQSPANPLVLVMDGDISAVAHCGTAVTQEQYNELLAENQALSDNLTAQQGQIDALTTENQALSENLTALQGQVADLESENEALREQVNSLEAENEALQEEVAGLNSSLEEILSGFEEIISLLGTPTGQRSSESSYLGEFGDKINEIIGMLLEPQGSSISDATPHGKKNK